MDGLSVIKRAATAIPRWPFTINRQSEQASGLLAWYPGVDYRSLDLTGRFTGAPQGTPAFQGPTIDGQQAIYCANTIYELLPTNLDVTGAITLSCWAMFNSGASGGNYPTFIAKRANSGASATNYALRLGSASGGDKTICFYFTDAGVGFQVYASSSAMPASDLTPFHVAVSYIVGVNPKIFWNGITQAGSFLVGSAVALQTNGTAASIGALADGGEFFTGRIWDVRVYNRALSDFEVWALYDPATRYELYQPVHSRLYFAPIAGANTRVSDFNIAIGAV